MSIFKKLLLIPIIFVLSLFPSECDGGKNTDDNGNNVNNTEIVHAELEGKDIFTKSDKDVRICFFDIDNVISDDGKEWQRPYHAVVASHSSDCYLIKVGDTEILVDGGHQTPRDYGENENERIRSILKDNILPKLAMLCEDGVLEYVIVTHADYDHIAMLAVEGGIFDAFTDWESYSLRYMGEKKIFNEGQGFKRIERVIDFDSPIVKEHSGDRTNSLLSSDAYRNYVAKRDKAINYAAQNGCKNAVHVPASAFFQELFDKDEDGNFIDSDDKNRARPDYFIRNDKIPVDFPKTAIDDDIINKIDGDLKKENEASYYEISLSKKTKLRILYNYFYDHLRQHSFDSQDKNNLSVCFEVVNNKFKFLSCGDAGGNGENALINYYRGTDILSNVSVFKASHHGSTTNYENVGGYTFDKGKETEYTTDGLLKVATPSVIVIPGVAQVEYKGDQLYNNIASGAVFLKKKLFDAIENYCPNATVLITNVASQQCHYTKEGEDYCPNKTLPHFVDAPFCGDIYIGSDGIKLEYAYSYIGEIEYYLIRNEIGTISDGSRSLLTTEWYQKAKELNLL